MHRAEGATEFQHMWLEDQGFLCLHTQTQVGDESVCTTSCTWSWTSWLEGRLLMEQEDLGLSHHEAQEWRIIGGWRDGSTVKSTDCFSRGPEFKSQQSYDLMPSSGLCLKTATVYLYIINKQTKNFF